MRSAVRSFAAVALLALSSCAPADDHGHVHEGTTATSDDGKVVISYVVTSGPLARSGNTFEVELKTPAGAQLEGAAGTLEFRLDGQETQVLVYEPGSSTGKYVGQSAHTFAAAGEWRMTVHVNKGEHDAADHLHDHATFKLAVP